MTDWRQRNRSFFEALKIERTVIFLILTLIILVAALNIISGMTMLVKDKGRDIAILRTMGATRGAVLRIFLVTGARSPRRYHLMLPELQRCNRQVKALHVVPDAAHAMNRENPAAFNVAVMDFIAGHCSEKMDDTSRGLVA